MSWQLHRVLILHLLLTITTSLNVEKNIEKRTSKVNLDENEKNLLKVMDESLKNEIVLDALHSNLYDKVFDATKGGESEEKKESKSEKEKEEKMEKLFESYVKEKQKEKSKGTRDEPRELIDPKTLYESKLRQSGTVCISRTKIPLSYQAKGLGQRESPPDVDDLDEDEMPHHNQQPSLVTKDEGFHQSVSRELKDILIHHEDEIDEDERDYEVDEGLLEDEEFVDRKLKRIAKKDPFWFWRRRRRSHVATTTTIVPSHYGSHSSYYYGKKDALIKRLRRG
uniref:Cnidarian restricted protein n=1 Tax=Clytia hemisphaerica TaxID=252671 RepID=A0A7M5WXJ6_9CNID